MTNEELMSLIKNNNGDVPLFYQMMNAKKREVLSKAPLFLYVQKYDGEIMIHKEFYKSISRVFIPSES